jgi:hypothetical protein
MAYATPADLASFMQVPSVDTATANLILGGVSIAMDEWAGQPLAQQDITGLLIDGTGTAELLLPGFPVNSVASIEILGADGIWTLLTAGVDYDWSASGVLRRRWPHPDPAGDLAPPWPGRPESVRAAYNRGAGGVSEALRFVCLGASARLMPNPSGLVSEQIGGMQLRYSAKTSGMEFTALEQRILDRASESFLA